MRLDQANETWIVLQSIEIRCVLQHLGRDPKGNCFFERIQRALDVAQLLVSYAGIEQHVRVFGLKAKCGFNTALRLLLFPTHGVIERQTTQQVSVVRVEVPPLFAQADCLLIRRGGFLASTGGPIVCVSQVAPKHIVLRI